MAVRRRASGVTLVELLCVIGIVAALAAIILTIVSMARGRATETTCLSNLRQIHAACSLYASDHDSALPFYSNRMDQRPKVNGLWALPEDHSESLVSSLRPYATADAIWFCPSDYLAGQDSGPHAPDLHGRLNHRHTSYVYVQGPYSTAAGARPPFIMNIDLSNLRRSRPVSPADFYLFTDNVWDCKNNDGWQSQARYSHRGRLTAVYYDGHARSFRLEDSACIPK